MGKIHWYNFRSPSNLWMICYNGSWWLAICAHITRINCSYDCLLYSERANEQFLYALNSTVLTDSVDLAWTTPSSRLLRRRQPARVDEDHVHGDNLINSSVVKCRRIRTSNSFRFSGLFMTKVYRKTIRHVWFDNTIRRDWTRVPHIWASLPKVSLWVHSAVVWLWRWC